MRGDVAEIARPAHHRQVGQPARQGDVAQVAPAVDQRGLWEEGGDPAEVERVLRHLVHDAESRTAHRLERSLVADGEVPDGGLVEFRDAVQGRLLASGGLGHPSKNLANEPQLTRTEDSGVAGQDLLDQGCARSRKADDEDRPSRGKATQVNSREVIAGEGGDEPIDEYLM